MFIIFLTYKVDLKTVEAFLPEHVDYLNEQYIKGYFILSGRKKPRTGGVIISVINDPHKLNEVLAQDPFYKEGLANYEVTEVVPTKALESLSFLV